MRTAVRILLLLAAALTLAACGIYSFTGTSIQPDVNTVTINYFEYRAEKVNPSLSNDLTEALRTRFRRSTRLEQVEQDGDLETIKSGNGRMPCWPLPFCACLLYA